MPTASTAVHGIAVLDVHNGRWATWQVSTAQITGSGRAESTNAVVTNGFDEQVFRSLSYQRPVIMTSRAQKHCQEETVLEAPAFEPDVFLADCASWIDRLQDLFWAENENRNAYNTSMIKARKEAKAAGRPLPHYQRRAPLLDIDWPGPPHPHAWESSAECADPVNKEAVRVANGCIQLLNYWREIENDRLRKSRSFFHGLPLLEADGFITIYPRRGAVVRRLTTQDVEELFDVRESLEILAFRLAASNSQRKPVTALETELQRARDAIERGDEGAAASANIGFHRAVVELADNSLLSMLVQPLFGRMEWLFRMTSDRDVLTQCAEHETLFKAIQSGQSELAASLAFVHITSGRQPTLEKLESHQSLHVVGTVH